MLGQFKIILHLEVSQIVKVMCIWIHYLCKGRTVNTNWQESHFFLKDKVPSTCPWSQSSFDSLVFSSFFAFDALEFSFFLFFFFLSSAMHLKRCLLCFIHNFWMFCYKRDFQIYLVIVNKTKQKPHPKQTNKF